MGHFNVTRGKKGVCWLCTFCSWWLFTQTGQKTMGESAYTVWMLRFGCFAMPWPIEECHIYVILQRKVNTRFNSPLLLFHKKRSVFQFFFLNSHFICDTYSKANIRVFVKSNYTNDLSALNWYSGKANSSLSDYYFLHYNEHWKHLCYCFVPPAKLLFTS